MTSFGAVVLCVNWNSVECLRVRSKQTGVDTSPSRRQTTFPPEQGRRCRQQTNEVPAIENRCWKVNRSCRNSLPPAPGPVRFHSDFGSILQSPSQQSYIPDAEWSLRRLVYLVNLQAPAAAY